MVITYQACNEIEHGKRDGTFLQAHYHRQKLSQSMVELVARIVVLQLRTYFKNKSCSFLISFKELNHEDDIEEDSYDR